MSRKNTVISVHLNTPPLSGFVLTLSIPSIWHVWGGKCCSVFSFLSCVLFTVACLFVLFFRHIWVWINFPLIYFTSLFLSLRFCWKVFFVYSLYFGLVVKTKRLRSFDRYIFVICFVIFVCKYCLFNQGLSFYFCNCLTLLEFKTSFFEMGHYQFFF